MKRTELLISGLALLATVCSCSEFKFEVNEDYDLNNLKIDKISGLDSLVLPIGSTKAFSISDYLDLEEVGEFIKTDDDGNFYLSLSDSELLNESFTIDEFSFNGYESPQAYKIGVDTPVIIPTLNLDQEIEVTLPFADVQYEVEINQSNIPDLVAGLRYADVTAALEVRFQYDQAQFPFKAFYIAAGTSFEFPEWITLGEVSSDFNKVAPNKVEFKANTAITDGGISLNFPIDMVDFRKLPEGQGVLGDGKLYLKAVAKLTNGNLILKSSDCTSAGTYTPSLSTYIHLDPMSVDSICLSDINLGDAVSISQEISLSDVLPEIFYGEGIVMDLNDLKLKLKLSNGLPFSGSINTELDTYGDGGATLLHNYKIALPFYFDPEGKEVEYEYTESGENSSIKVDEFDSLLNPAPDFLRINASLAIDSSEEENYGVIATGSTYSVKCGYEFLAPLSFGPDFLLSYSQDITGLGIEAEESLEGLEVAEVDLNCNIVNALPFDLELSALALDVDGNVVENIEVKLNGEIKGGSVQSPAVNPVTLVLTNNGKLNFDGVRLSLSASVSQEKAVLNKDQFVQLTDISVSLPEGASYTFPEIVVDQDNN